MLFTASTVKDTLPNLRRFVAGNLAGGADHLVVFVDDPDGTDPAAVDFLAAHDGVTCVLTDDEWWAGDRPGQLNVRQRINANVVKAVLSRLDPAHGWADWVFHIDADEIVQIDRMALSSAPETASVVRLAPLEAVSQQHWDDDPTLFKRLLEDDDLTLLHTLGVIDRSHNGAYFHGHVDGKSGVRPTLDLWLALHHVVDADKTEQDRVGARGAATAALRVVLGRGLRAQVDGDPRVGRRRQLPQGPRAHGGRAAHPDRQGADRRAGAALPDADLRAHHRGRPPTLRDLGLLEEVDPRAGGHTPAAFPDGGRAAFLALLDGLRPLPKRDFHPGRPADAVRRLLDQADGPTARLRECVSSCGGPDHQPVLEQARQAAVSLLGLRPGLDQPLGGDRAGRLAQHGEQPAPALPVGAVVGLPLPRRTVVRRVAGRAPRARVTHGAVGAARASRGADEGAQLHQGDRPGRRRRVVGGEQPSGPRALADGDSGGRELPPSSTRVSTRRTLVSRTAWRRV